MAAPTWVGAATGGVNANANTTVTYPVGTTTDDLLILFIECALYANGTLTWTTPSGWAELATVTSGGAAPIDHKIYVRWCGGETSVTVSINVGTSRVTTAALHVWRGTDMTNPFDAYALTYDTAANSTTQTHPSITTTVADTVVSRFFSGAYTSASTCTVTQSGGSQTERTDHSITYSSNNKLVEASSTESFASAGATGTRTFTSTITNGANGLGIVAVRGPQPGNYTGDASTTGTATLTAAGTRGANSDSTATTATATLSADGIRAANSDSTTTTATATLTAAGTRGAVVGASTTATATLTADGVRAASSDAETTATATLTAAGTRVTSTDSTTTTGTATLTAGGAVSALGSAPTTGTATLTSNGWVATSGGATLATTATLTADGTVGTPPGGASTVGTATLTADGAVTARGNASTTATATLTAAGVVALSGDAPTTATATLTAAGAIGSLGGATRPVTATLTAAGSVTVAGGAETVVTAVLTANGNVQAPAAGQIMKHGQAPSIIARGSDGVHATAVYLGERLIWDGTRAVMVRIPVANGAGLARQANAATGAIAVAVTAAGSGVAYQPAPVVSVNLDAPVSLGSGLALPPEVGVPADTSAPPAQGTAFAPAPGVLVTDDAIGTGVTAIGPGSAPAATPVVDALVVVPIIYGSGVALAPTPGISTTSVAPAATGASSAPAPVVKAASTLITPPGMGSGFGVAPSLVVGSVRAAVTATGSGIAPAPTPTTTVVIADTFNRTGPTLGADWVTLGQAPVINTNRVQGGTTGASSATTAYAARHATPLTQANQEVTQWIVQPVGTQSYVQGSEAFCRSNSAGTERVSVRATISGTTHTLTIYSYNGGTATSRGSTTSYKFDLFGNPLRLAPTAVGIRAVGNVYTVILNDIPTTLTWTDSGNLVSQANRYWGFQVYTTESGTGAATYSNAIAHMDGKDYTGETPEWKTLTWMQPGYGTKQDGWGYYSASTTTFHNGVDVVGSAGRNIYAAADGVVVYTETGHVKGDPGYGNYVSLGHAGGIGTDYAHMSTVIATVGQTVSMGDVIGLTGTTGNSTTAHLHFGVRRGAIPWLGAADPWIKDTQFPYQDPERFLTDVGVTLNWSVDPG